MRKLREAGKPTKPATVHELRASSSDRSLRKGDLTVDELATDGRQTLSSRDLRVYKIARRAADC